MQTDLHDFLIRLVSSIALALIPVVLIAVLSMPSSLHHHFGGAPTVPHAASAHMT